MQVIRDDGYPIAYADAPRTSETASMHTICMYVFVSLPLRTPPVSVVLWEILELTDIESRLSGFLFRIRFSFHIIVGKQKRVSKIMQPPRADRVPTVTARTLIDSMASDDAPEDMCEEKSRVLCTRMDTQKDDYLRRTINTKRQLVS